MSETNALPLEGVRILAVEQMQAMPFGTQLLARMGADVVKVEHPTRGESGRGSLPSITDEDGGETGATFLRNNLAKRSLGLDLKNPKGAELLKKLVPAYDVVVENFKPGTMESASGIGYETLARRSTRAWSTSRSRASARCARRPTANGRPTPACPRR